MLDGLTAMVGDDTVTLERFLSRASSSSSSSRWWWHLQASLLPSSTEVVSLVTRCLSVRGQGPFWSQGWAFSLDMVILVLGLGSSSLARSLRASMENHGGHL